MHDNSTSGARRAAKSSRKQPATPGRPRSAAETQVDPGHEPSWPQKTTLLLASGTLSRLLRANELPDPTVLGGVIDEHIADLRAKAKGVKFVRGDVLRAHGFVGRYLHRWMPADLTFAGDTVWRTVRDMVEGGSAVARHCEQLRPARRLAWAADTADLGVGLVLDRLHYTHRDDCVLDPWMLEQVRADLALGVELAGEMFAGVRVLAPLTPLSSVHVSAEGVSHHVGGCAWCAGVSPWASAQPAQTAPEQQPSAPAAAEADRDEDAA